MNFDQHLVDYTVRNITTGDEEDIRVIELSSDEFDGFPESVRAEVRQLVEAVGEPATVQFDMDLWDANSETIRQLLLPFISRRDLYDADYEAWEAYVLDDAEETTMNAVTTETLAHTFRAVLGEWLSTGELHEIRIRNAGEAHPGVCHTHDFCDANMAMYESFVRHGLAMRESDMPAEYVENAEIIGGGPDLPIDDAVWGEAWDIAKARWLTATPAEVAAWNAHEHCGECAGPVDGDALLACLDSHALYSGHCKDFVYCEQSCLDTYHRRFAAAPLPSSVTDQAAGL